ncbi:MAG: hypothetical protein JO341_10400 [Gammaproteobacteria bacterium]|nr:hypothetical protein [Gammaproteobacteria bacterium]MBV9621419.1 hypothetical protein [Gammaproteobacteria bacterium]
MRPLLHCAFCIIWLNVALAKTTVIDDGGTLPYNASLALRWQQPSPRSPDANRMVGTLTLRVRLNVSPWLRRSGRIYLALPAQQPGTLSARWSTQGRLLAGQVSAGGRALVYAGPLTTPFIEDTVQLTLDVDGRRMQQAYQVNFRFEMDEE